MSRVCLFDIDGTLLSSGGAGQHAMEQALLEAFSVTGPYEDIPAAGRTDKAIIADLFDYHYIEVSSDNLTRFLAAYTDHLPKSLHSQNGHILPGVVPLLDALSRRSDCDLGLLTGNFAIGADLKLKHYHLDHYFAFGGFGDDHSDRDDVARLALQNAQQHLQRDVAGTDVWVLGDTPSDICCARAIGARVVAVATGIFSASELDAAQPDVLFDDFSDVDAVLSSLLSHPC